MATGAPAGASRHEPGVINSTDEQSARSGLLLKVAFNAKGLVALSQQLVIDRSVHGMATGASFPDCLVFEDEWATLGGVALAAGIIDLGESGAHTPQPWAFMRVVAIAAADLALRDRMVRRQGKFTAFIQMTLKTDLRRSARVDNIPSPTTGLDMHAPGSMTGLAAHFERVGAFGPEIEVHRTLERLGDCLMAFGTGV